MVGAEPLQATDSPALESSDALAGAVARVVERELGAYVARLHHGLERFERLLQRGEQCPAATGRAPCASAPPAAAGEHPPAGHAEGCVAPAVADEGPGGASEEAQSGEAQATPPEEAEASEGKARVGAPAADDECSVAPAGRRRASFRTSSDAESGSIESVAPGSPRTRASAGDADGEDSGCAADGEEPNDEPGVQADEGGRGSRRLRPTSPSSVAPGTVASEKTPSSSLGRDGEGLRRAASDSHGHIESEAKPKNLPGAFVLKAALAAVKGETQVAPCDAQVSKQEGSTPRTTTRSATCGSEHRRRSGTWSSTSDELDLTPRPDLGTKVAAPASEVEGSTQLVVQVPSLQKAPEGSHRLSVYFNLGAMTTIKKVNLKDRAAHWIHQSTFDYITGTIIVLNACFVGVQTEFAAVAARNQKEEPAFLNHIATAFCAIFTVELCLRLMANGHHFFIAADWRWNIFDLVVVVLQVAEELLSQLSDSTNFSSGSSWMRILRVLRLVRITRLVRLLRVLRELRTIVGSIVCTFRSLVWTMLLLLVVIYSVGVCFTQLVADHGRGQYEDIQSGTPLATYFGSTGKTILSLYQAISGGIDWIDLTDPLDAKISPLLSVAFCLFIAFTTLSLLNVVTGIFVEAALQNTKAETDLHMVTRLREIFAMSDLMQSGRIHRAHFDARLDDPQMTSLLKSVDLDVSEAKALFRLLDVHDVGSIQAEDFIAGCLRLRGPAKAIDLAALMSETRRTNRHLRTQMASFRKVLDGSMSLGPQGRPSAQETAFFANCTEQNTPSNRPTSPNRARQLFARARAKTGPLMMAKNAAAAAVAATKKPLPAAATEEGQATEAPADLAANHEVAPPGTVAPPQPATPPRSRARAPATPARPATAPPPGTLAPARPATALPQGTTAPARPASAGAAAVEKGPASVPVPHSTGNRLAPPLPPAPVGWGRDDGSKGGHKPHSPPAQLPPLPPRPPGSAPQWQPRST